MPRFEVHIPAADPSGINVTLRVDADHWMAALRTGLHKLGEQGSSVQNVLVDIQDDSSVHVTESRTGRVFQIREVPPTGEVSKAAAAPQPLPLVELAKRSAPQQPSTAPVIGVQSPPMPEDERPTLLDLPAAAPLPLRDVLAQKAPALVPEAPPEAPEVPVSKPPARRDSSGWPWATSLSAHGEVEGTRTERNSVPPAAIGRTPAGISRLEPSSVVELQRPSQPMKGQIGRTLGKKRDQREEIEDALSDIFERVQDVYVQESEKAAMYLLLDLALEKIAADSGSVLMSDTGTGDLTFTAARGPKAQELLQAQLMIPAGVGIAGFCAAEGVSVALSDVQKDPRWYSEVSERLRYQTKSVLCAPMMTHGRAFGCIQLINRKGTDIFSEHEIGMLAYIAHQAALYLNTRS